MQTYESLEDITVYVFFKILETENYSFMIKDDEQRLQELN